MLAAIFHDFLVLNRSFGTVAIKLNRKHSCCQVEKI